MWKPQPHWVIANWLGFMEPVRGESCPSSQRRSPAAPGEDKFLYSGQKPFHFSTTSTNGDETADPPGRYRLERCGNPNPTDRCSTTARRQEPQGIFVPRHERHPRGPSQSLGDTETPSANTRILPTLVGFSLVNAPRQPKRLAANDHRQAAHSSLPTSTAPKTWDIGSEAD